MQASVTYVITVCDGVHGSNKPLSKPTILFNHQNENIKKYWKWIPSNWHIYCHQQHDYVILYMTTFMLMLYVYIYIYIYMIINIPLFRNVHLTLRFVMALPITKLWLMFLCVNDLGNHRSMLWNVAYSVSSNYLSQFSLSTGRYGGDFSGIGITIWNCQ